LTTEFISEVARKKVSKAPLVNEEEIRKGFLKAPPALLPYVRILSKPVTKEYILEVAVKC
jgi:hypothetical protein